MQMLITHPEKVFLVVIIKTAIPAHPHKAVVIIAGISDDQASTDNTMFFGSFFCHPLDAFSVHGLSIGFGFHGKPCIEHLRKYDEVGGIIETPELFIEILDIGNRVFPGQARLYQRYFQILHRIFAALSRVSSFLAKQSRSTLFSSLW